MEVTNYSLGELEAANPQISAADVDDFPELPHATLLTDCCRLYGSVLRLQSQVTERSTRIMLAFLRDA